MTDREHRDQMREHILASMKRINARCYAIDPQTETSLTALAVAWLEQRNEADQKFSANALDAFLTDNIAPFVSGFAQRLPSEPPPKPELWRDEITGEGAKTLG